MTPLLSVTQVAEILNCSEQMVYKLAKHGKLRCVDVGMGTIRKKGKRFKQSEIRRFIEDNSN